MIVRDVDILAEAAQREGCNVCFSVTTLDRELARDLDPGTAPPMQRLKALERLREEGVTAGVSDCAGGARPDVRFEDPRRSRPVPPPITARLSSGPVSCD